MYIFQSFKYILFIHRVSYLVAMAKVIDKHHWRHRLVLGPGVGRKFGVPITRLPARHVALLHMLPSSPPIRLSPSSPTNATRFILAIHRLLLQFLLLGYPILQPWPRIQCAFWSPEPLVVPFPHLSNPSPCSELCFVFIAVPI